MAVEIVKWWSCLPTSSVTGASFTLLYFTATAFRAGSIPDHDRNTINQ